MENPVQIHSHGGRAHLVQTGELNIDVAFLGVPCCDEYGNATALAANLAAAHWATPKWMLTRPNAWCC